MYKFTLPKRKPASHKTSGSDLSISRAPVKYTKSTQKIFHSNLKFKWPHLIIFAAIIGVTGSYFLVFAKASSPITLEGKLEIIVAPHSDTVQDEDREHAYNFNDDYYGIVTDDRQHIRLNFKEKPKIQPGSRIKIKGSKPSTASIGTSTALAADNTASGIAVESTEVLQAAVLPKVLGPQKVAAIKVNFSNISYAAATDATISTAFFSGPKSTNAFIKQASYKKASLEGSSIFKISIPNRNDEPGAAFGCAFLEWAEAAIAGAASQGVDLSGYSYFVFLLPQSPVCQFLGLAEVGGSHFSWFNGATAIDAYSFSHEIGHNFGLQHANGYDCKLKGKKVQISTTCAEVEYADKFDSVGDNTSVPIHYNIIHKEHLGWLYSSNIQDITQSGTYKIYRNEVSSAKPQAIRFPRRDTNQFYYLETRRAVGFDAEFLNKTLYPNGEVVRGVSIRLGQTADNTTLLLKADPAVKNAWLAAPITTKAGGATDTFTDAAAGVVIKFITKTDFYSQVSVTFTKPPIGTGESAPPSNSGVAPAPRAAGPTTPILDDFNRPDEYPLSQNGQWAPNDPRCLTCYDFLGVLSFQAGRSNPDKYQHLSYRPVNIPGDVEVYATVASKPTVENHSITLLFNIREVCPIQCASWDGFYLEWIARSGTDELRISRIINNGYNEFLNSGFVEIETGDKLLARRIGNRIEGWVYKGGSWSLAVTATDTILGGGYIGLAINNPTSRWDDFGGGVFVPPPASDIINPLSQFNINDCGSRGYMSAVDDAETLSPTNYIYNKTFGGAYNSPYPGTVPLYDNLAFRDLKGKCTYEEHFFSTNANQTKPLNFADDRTWTREDEVAWVYPSQVSGTVPLYQWTCPDQDGTTFLTDFWDTNIGWINNNYARPETCTRNVLAYILPP